MAETIYTNYDLIQNTIPLQTKIHSEARCELFYIGRYFLAVVQEVMKPCRYDESIWEITISWLK